MTAMFLGLYGLYFILVAAQGNTSALLPLFTRDAPHYFPWLLAIIALSTMYQIEATRDLVKPFIALVILNFVLMNFGTIKSELQKMYNLSQS